MAPPEMAGTVRPRTDRVRLTAHSVLSAVSTRDAYANLLLASALREAGLHGKDAALATELVYGTLRNRGCYDAIIGLCADRAIDQIDLPVLDALRLGAHQLLSLRIKSHAAVATAVDLVISVAGRRPSGFANAVLRRIAPRDLESWIQIVAPDRSEDLTGHLSVRYSHPRWIVAAFADALGEKLIGSAPETEAVLAADAGRPIVHLTAAPGHCDPAELVESGAAAAARWSPFGAYLRHGDPAEIAAVAAGRAWVQDEASQLAAYALTQAATQGDGQRGDGQRGDGQRWLDLCAGPGGKARLLAGLAAQRDTALLACDVHAHRAELVRAAFGRLSVASGDPGAEAASGNLSAVPGDPSAASRSLGAASGNLSVAPGDGHLAAQVVVADGTVPAWRAGAFDRVLADVPCSGLGSLRRRPEARWRRQPDDIVALAGLQRGLLTSALDAARPGGVVGYVTCSPHLAETRQVLADVLATRAGIEVLDAPAVLAEVPDLRCPEPYSRYAQFWPHRHGTDAIFVALLRIAS
ncbi:MAG TPA: transcription antitermination factor NusB [Streptosporangiaceae bacterium]|nr:transcription antitermination factor NusB [Streptosporangiaceae bacterium]